MVKQFSQLIYFRFRYEEFMQEEYNEAEALLLHILELMRLRQAIEKMSRATISEVHSYGAPPRVVKSVMKAVFLLLGENAKELVCRLTVSSIN